MLTTEQRISVVSWRLNGLPFAEVQELFRRHYRIEAPTGTKLRGLVNKFQRTGNIYDEKRSGWPLTLQETGETIQQAIKQSPKESTHHLNQEHGIPMSTVWQTLRFVLKKKASYIQVIHYLEPEDYAACMALCHNLNETVQAHRGEMVTLLGCGGQSCRTAVISLNYGVFFHFINISLEIKCSFPEMVRDFSGTLYVVKIIQTVEYCKLIVLG